MTTVRTENDQKRCNPSSSVARIKSNVLNSNYSAIVQMIADFNNGNHYFVGMSDEIKEGEWQLVNGDIHDASDESQGGFWKKGQPNNSRGREHCAMLRRGLFLLYDVPCDWKQHGICELNEC